MFRLYLQATRIMKEHSAVFPELSVAVYLMVYSPTLKEEPLTDSVKAVTLPSELSNTVGGSQMTCTVGVVVFLFTSLLGGQYSWGFSVSGDAKAERALV